MTGCNDVLQGIALCRQCGERMTMRYHTGTGAVTSWVCQPRAGIADGGPVKFG